MLYEETYGYPDPKWDEDDEPELTFWQEMEQKADERINLLRKFIREEDCKIKTEQYLLTSRDYYIGELNRLIEISRYCYDRNKKHI